MRDWSRKRLFALFGVFALLTSVFMYVVISGFLRNESETGFLWMQPAVCGFDNCGSAIYRDSVLYVPSKGDDNVYAVNAVNGEVIWNTTVRQCDFSPCIDGEVIYVGEWGSNPRALALNKTDGRIIWQFIQPENKSWAGSPLVNGDYVYYTTYGSGVYALNKTNGDTIWHRNIGELLCSAAYHNGVIFVSAFMPAGQYAFNATTGEEKWHVNYGPSWESSPVVYDGMIIQVTFETKSLSNSSYGRKLQFRRDVYSVCVLNETSGELIRKFENKGGPNTPLIHNGRILIPDDDHRIWAYNLNTGIKLWNTVRFYNETLLEQKLWVTTFPAKNAGPQDITTWSEDFTYCSPAGSGGAIYYQSLDGIFYVINQTNGRIRWSYPLNGRGFGSPSIGDGCVFVTNDFALYAFEIGSGSGDWPMYCQNALHRSVSEHGIQSIKLPNVTTEEGSEQEDTDKRKGVLPP